MASLERTTPFRLLESHVLNGVGAGLLQPLHLDQGCVELFVSYMAYRYTWMHYVGVEAAKTTLYAKGGLKLLLEVKPYLEQI